MGRKSRRCMGEVSMGFLASPQAVHYGGGYWVSIPQNGHLRWMSSVFSAPASEWSGPNGKGTPPTPLSPHTRNHHPSFSRWRLHPGYTIGAWGGLDIWRSCVPQPEFGPSDMNGQAWCSHWLLQDWCWWSAHWEPGRGRDLSMGEKRLQSWSSLGLEFPPSLS